jgi:hypothetical protein
MSMVPNMRGSSLRYFGMVLGCCLWTAISGCSWQRGAISTVQSWMPGGGHLAGQKTPATKKIADTQSVAARRSESVIDESAPNDKPELLAFRSRMKGYRLGARLARGSEADSDSQSDQMVAYSTTHEAKRKPLSKLLGVEKNDAVEEERLNPSLDNGELQMPVSVGVLPRAGRHDPMID